MRQLPREGIESATHIVDLHPRKRLPEQHEPATNVRVAPFIVSPLQSAPHRGGAQYAELVSAERSFQTRLAKFRIGLHTR